MTVLRSAAAGVAGAAGAVLADSLTPGSWLLIGAVLLDLWRSRSGARGERAGWFLLTVAAAVIAFGNGAAVLLILAGTGVLCLLLLDDAPGRVAAIGLCAVTAWIAGAIVVGPASAEVWLATEASAVGWIVGLPTSGAVIGEGAGAIALLTGCASLPMALDLSIAVFAAARLFDVRAGRAATVAAVFAALMFAVNIGRLCAMARINCAYELLHTDAFNQLSSALLLAGAVGVLVLRDRSR